MTKKIDGKKIGGVKSTTQTETVEQTSSVSGSSTVGGVSSVKATSGVAGIRGAHAIGKRLPTRTMTSAERAELMRLIDEETERMVSSGIIPASKKEAVQGAVRMTVDAGVFDDDSDDQDQEKKKKN